MLRNKDLTLQHTILENFKAWRAKKTKQEAVGREDIGRMLMTTSEATSGLTPREILDTEEAKPPAVIVTEGSYGGSFAMKEQT